MLQVRQHAQHALGRRCCWGPSRRNAPVLRALRPLLAHLSRSSDQPPPHHPQVAQGEQRDDLRRFFANPR